ncbi:ribosome biogenesis regulatory protein homolog [Gigantopelta aegis]|uniref:ribosome biogenesis regulatory protein homolog n=1 Tax=Gigantopelta aegis TaxID=1735272 RepID=UPI001B88766E|nr:ribosome biogenesis regulatory protein homolog [Gigantopelta aegis]
MEDLVENVLRSVAEKEAKYKTTKVEKAIDLDIDEGNLLACDANPLDVKLFRSNKEDYLKALTRDNSQLLINKLWQLPVEKVDGVAIAVLPDRKTWMPREKPVPKPKADTKWQAYAMLKGIKNKKKGRMVFEEKTKSYKPRWGYKRANDYTNEWLIEVPQNADPYEDQFAKRKGAKKERVAKNELQRLRNIARSQKSKVPGVGLTPTETPSKDHLSKALVVAKKSTASIGRFTENLPKEKTSKHSGRKRKFESNYGDLKKEAKKQLDILNSITNKQPRLDVNVAVRKQLAEEKIERSKSNQNGPPAKGSKKKGGGKHPKGGKGWAGPKGGKGKKSGKKGGMGKPGKGGMGKGGMGKPGKLKAFGGGSQGKKGHKKS